MPSYDKNALRIKEGMPACIMGFRMADFALTKSVVPSLLGLVGPGSSPFRANWRKTKSLYPGGKQVSSVEL